MLNAANWTARLNELATDANVPGAALGIWSDGQEILAAHGVLNAVTQVPVTTDSVFQVGSITKIWTATMIMQLVDEGLLSLDTTVSDVLPGTRLGTADVGGAGPPSGGAAGGDARVVLPGGHGGHVVERLLLDLLPGRAGIAAGLPRGHPLEALVERLQGAGLVGAVAAVAAGLYRHAAALTSLLSVHSFI